MVVHNQPAEQQQQQQSGNDGPSAKEQQQQFDLIVFGSIVQDLVTYVDRFPRPGESVRGNCFKTFCGGKGANQAVMGAKLGSKVAMIGCVGDDLFANNNIQSIAQNGVDVSMIQKLKGHSTGTATIAVSEDGENCIMVTLSANEQLGAKRAQELDSVIGQSKMLLCQLEIDQDGNLEAFRVAKRHGVTTFFNPAPGRADLDKRILPLCDIICMNENEAEFLTGLQVTSDEKAEAAARLVLEMGPRIAIVTLGPKGALVAQRPIGNGKIILNRVDAPKVKAVDTTGAGDCFCGSLAHFLVASSLPVADKGANVENGEQQQEDHLVQAVQKAVQIAAISVQKQGTQASYPSREELTREGIIQQ